MFSIHRYCSHCVLLGMFLLAACSQGEFYSACLQQESLTKEACACLNEQVEGKLDADAEHFMTVLMWGDSDEREQNRQEDLAPESLQAVSDFLPSLSECGVGIRINNLGF